MSRTRGEKIGGVIICIFLFALSLIMIYPFWHVLMYSISEPERALGGGLFFYPRGISFFSYSLVLRNAQIWIAYKNTILKTLFGTLISVVLSAMTAYPLSVKRLRGRNFFSMMIFFTMLFGGGTIPTYLLVKSLSLIDTFWALILPGAVSAYNMFILRNYMQSLPSELEESARIDGAMAFTILFRIILPLAAPSLAAIAMFYGVSNWNSYMDCLLYTNSTSLQTLQLYLRQVLLQTSSANAAMTVTGETSEYVSDTQVQMVIVAVSVIPILIVYPYLQRFYTKGITVGAVKG
ncbi:MAG: carbohydrate ABC transporter permease [Clostridia bacterium]|nr:carbohydrate ABC transporter permease [Clostridia bacterium]